MSLALPPWTSGHPSVWALSPCAGHPLPANRAPAPKPAGDLAQKIELGWFVFIVLDGQGQHLQCPAKGRVSSPLEVAPWVMVVTVVTPPTGIPAIVPGRGPLPDTDTNTRPGTRRLPARAAQRVLGRERGRARGAGPRGGRGLRPAPSGSWAAAVWGGAGRQVVPGGFRGRAGVERRHLRSGRKY